MYGRAEAVVGELATSLNLQPSLFLATKVWTSGRDAGIRQMQDSLRLMRTPRMNLIQVHNLLDLPTHLKTLREWKTAGTIRYLGITHYHSGAYAELEKLLKTREYDFVQFNYSLAEREAEQRLLGVAAESGTAVIINRPFAQGELFPKVKVMGSRFRLHKLGTIFPQIHNCAPRCHLCHSRNRQSTPHDR